MSRWLAVTVSKWQGVEVSAKSARRCPDRGGTASTQRQTRDITQSVTMAECRAEFNDCLLALVQNYRVYCRIVVEHFCPSHAGVLAATRDMALVTGATQVACQLQEFARSMLELNAKPQHPRPEAQNCIRSGLHLVGLVEWRYLHLVARAH
jgi:hypothetical protein